MFIELVHDLRCPRAHEETWLVASAERTEGRDIMEGTLGCPVCHAEYAIRDGVVWFTEPEDVGRAASGAPRQVDAEVATRLAAFLDLTDAQGFALLTGSWAPAAPLLRDLVPSHFIPLNADPAVPAGNGVSPVQMTGGIPLADGTCRGVALDEAHAAGAYLEAAVRVLHSRGRLVAPASIAPPVGVTELARDERLWVAEREAAPPRLVALRGRDPGR